MAGFGIYTKELCSKHFNLDAEFIFLTLPTLFWHSLLYTFDDQLHYINNPYFELMIEYRNNRWIYEFEAMH